MNELERTIMAAEKAGLSYGKYVASQKKETEGIKLPSKKLKKYTVRMVVEKYYQVYARNKPEAEVIAAEFATEDFEKLLVGEDFFEISRIEAAKEY